MLIIISFLRAIINLYFQSISEYKISILKLIKIAEINYKSNVDTNYNHSFGPALIISTVALSSYFLKLF